MFKRYHIKELYYMLKHVILSVNVYRLLREDEQLWVNSHLDHMFRSEANCPFWHPITVSFSSTLEMAISFSMGLQVNKCHSASSSQRSRETVIMETYGDACSVTCYFIFGLELEICHTESSKVVRFIDFRIHVVTGSCGKVLNKWSCLQICTDLKEYCYWCNNCWL